VRAQATATACSLPCAHGVSLARWSRAELVRQLSAQPALEGVSTGTIGRWLRAEQIRPWRYRMWQHIHDPQAFLARARPVLQLYAQATSLLESGTWLVCVDEKTSIQARQAEQTPRPAIRGHCARQSPRYTRRGARHLIAGLSVADGHILGQCHKHKRFVDFQAFISEVLVPEAKRRGVHTVGLIVDNGPTHAPKQASIPASANALARWVLPTPGGPSNTTFVAVCTKRRLANSRTKRSESVGWKLKSKASNRTRRGRCAARKRRSSARCWRPTSSASNA